MLTTHTRDEAIINGQIGHHLAEIEKLERTLRPTKSTIHSLASDIMVLEGTMENIFLTLGPTPAAHLYCEILKIYGLNSDVDRIFMEWVGRSNYSAEDESRFWQGVALLLSKRVANLAATQ
jgi:hypothetical protein